jgi:hypothetical protein
MEERLIGWNNQCVAEFLSLEDQENGRSKKNIPTVRIRKGLKGSK